MSCDYDVFCRTCNAGYGFSDANHKDDAMRHLIRNATKLVELGRVLRELNDGGPWAAEIRAKFEIGLRPETVDVAWFEKHATHDLVVRDEYGRFDDVCWEYINCHCGARHNCVLPAGHAGTHTHKKATLEGGG